MKILIIGGTVFLGRALVTAALNRGHQVTLFNRGKSNSGLFPEVETLIGDRDGDLTALAGRKWDAVIDTCGYVPRIVKQSVGQLANKVEHYTFISSLSVYQDTSQPGVDESAPVIKLEDESVEEISNGAYGGLKALCEQAVQDNFPGQSLIIRPGLIVGPHDPSDRFSYWPYRVARGGQILAPQPPEREIQFIDVRDLAEWNIRLVEGNQTGIYNATGPAESLQMATFLETCKRSSNSEASFTWVSEDFLMEHEVGPWMELPLWLPPTDPDVKGFFATAISKAISAGLTFRPLEATISATQQWLSTRPADYQWKTGLSPEREAKLLALWKQ